MWLSPTSSALGTPGTRSSYRDCVILSKWHFRKLVATEAATCLFQAWLPGKWFLKLTFTNYLLNGEITKAVNWTGQNRSNQTGSAGPELYMLLRYSSPYVVYFDVLTLSLLKNMRASTASASLPLQWGDTAFLRASVNGHAEVAQFLLESGSVFHERNSVSV